MRRKRRIIYDTPEKAIAAKCRECGGGSLTEVELCPVTDCPLYGFRQFALIQKPKLNTTNEPKETKPAELGDIDNFEEIWDW